MPKIGVAMPTISRQKWNRQPDDAVYQAMMQHPGWDERIWWVIESQLATKSQVSLGGCVCLFLCHDTNNRTIWIFWIHLACISQRLKPTRPIAEQFCCKSLEHSSFREREYLWLRQLPKEQYVLCLLKTQEPRQSLGAPGRCPAKITWFHCFIWFHNYL